jgi:multiple sugar transport system ATP-binding protein
MDEPLSNLDAKLRVQMRAEIARLQSDLGVTTIYVTHDQTEAMTMGDRVAVMRKGELQQVDDPQVLYDHPVNIFVGGFIGSPAMNMLHARLEGDNGTVSAVVGEQRVRLSDRCTTNRPGLRAFAGRDVVLGIRPENLEDAAVASDAEEGDRLRGEVVLREALGSEIMAHVAIEAKPAETDETRELAQDAGAPDDDGAAVGVEEGKTILVARFNPRSRVKQGESTEIAVDTEALHFFDPETGLGIYENTKGARS